MNIVYDSLFVTNPAKYQTSTGIKLCNEHGKITEGALEAENFGYSEMRLGMALRSPTVLGKSVNQSVVARGTAQIHLTPKTVRPVLHRLSDPSTMVP